MGSTEIGSVVVTVDVSEAKNLVEAGHSFLDVRTPEEFGKGHCLATNIFNIPYMFNTPQGRVKNPDFLDQVSALLTPSHHILVGCQSGVRSLQATSDLMEAGFKNVSNMGGGYLAWVEKMYPVQVVVDQPTNNNS